MLLLTKLKSTFKDPFFVGVPTHMKTISEELRADLISEVKKRRLAKRIFLSNSFKPGS